MTGGMRWAKRRLLAIGLVGLVAAGVVVGAVIETDAVTPSGDPAGSVRYPGDLPVDAPRLGGVLVSSSGGGGIWSLRYSRDGFTPEQALADLTARGYAEEHRSRDENDVVRVSLLGSSPYLLALSWSDDDDRSEIDLVLRSPERRGILLGVS
ncbi:MULTISPECIES: hypothetical protein [unclassified Rathayibacter]|uniref:hypothetical protein n=1 Tax=unclassified Rathayibacter TaxID=2609250 RepID=UPI000701E34A|nr:MULTISPECIES: hypothetical protein [unclassified Rathayibacter]KQQ05980.1 hypothetical protein ASF42_05430 [Rathayibacter sp. Leaf294]KQS13837.1 hypothetical protein ASG06_05440 [Rathayibacter sp. Leaf185]